MHWGFGWLTPLLRIAAGDSVSEQLGEFEARARHPARRHRHLPRRLERARSARPDLARRHARAGAGVGAGVDLWADHKAEREQGGGVLRAPGRRAMPPLPKPARPTRSSSATTPASRPIFDQIVTSLKTVGLGFLIATLIAVPLGIACGLSPTRQRRDQPAHPDLQAGVAARLAADRHHGRLGALRRTRATRCRKRC